MESAAGNDRSKSRFSAANFGSAEQSENREWLRRGFLLGSFHDSRNWPAPAVSSTLSPDTPKFPRRISKSQLDFRRREFSLPNAFSACPPPSAFFAPELSRTLAELVFGLTTWLASDPGRNRSRNRARGRPQSPICREAALLNNLAPRATNEAMVVFGKHPSSSGLAPCVLPQAVLRFKIDICGDNLCLCLPTNSQRP